MVIVGRADEAVIADVHKLPKVFDAFFAFNDVINELLRGNACFCGFVFDLLTVFVRTCEEHNVIACEAFVTRHHIGGNGAIAVADVELIARIIDRGCDIKFFVFHWSFILSVTPLRMGRGGIFLFSERTFWKKFSPSLFQKLFSVAV